MSLYYNKSNIKIPRQCTYKKLKRLLSFSVFLGVFEGANQDENMACKVFETTTY